MPVKKSLNKKSKNKEEEDTIDIDVEETEKIEEETNDYDENDYVEPELDEDEDEEFPDEDLKFDDKENKLCDIDKALEEDNEYFEDEDDIEVQPDTTVEYVKTSERISAARLTKYEMVRILGERTKQLTMGAKPLIKNYQGLSYEKIAEEELLLNMIPYKIRRPLPNGKYELWQLEELNKQHLISLLE